ncbi:MAG: AAA family ATPase [Thermomicrobiales bacterium]
MATLATLTDSSITPRHAGPDAHLDALLRWLDRLLAWQVAVTRQTYGLLADDDYRGLYVSDGEADLLVGARSDLQPELAERRGVLADERQAIEDRFATEDSALPRLARLFDLTRFEQDVLLLATVPELDLRYERLYAYIQDDVTRKRPTVDLALRLFAPDLGSRLTVRASFAAESPLLRHRLVEIFEEGQRHAPLLARVLKVDDRIVAELIRQASLDPLLAPFVIVSHPSRQFDDLVLPVALLDQLRRTSVGTSGGSALALQGGYGSGRRVIAEALCTENGSPLLTVDLARMVESDLGPEEGTRRVIREATLLGASILWLGIDPLLQAHEPSPWRPAVLGALDDFAGQSFLPLEQAWESRGALQRTRFLRVTLPAPTYSERERLWEKRLNGNAPPVETLRALASTFRLSGGQIRDAVAMAHSLTSWHGDQLQADHLYAACRGQSSGKLDTLAHKIIATYRWGDIVLPTDKIGQLREICAQVRHRRTVLETWGFDRHLAMGKGLNVLFAGDSGTGKTMAAEIIATDIGLELYKVDLSTLVSKYIGETEKNLDRIFTAAREANAILFFDEADAIFGKRSEVKDAHDRYANIEVGYLLQKMEEYDGVVILATNLKKNIDDAFVRRLHMTIDFPFPEEEDRLRIWRKVFPPEAPLGADVDLDFLARQFKVTGGNIRNIALLAAFLAAEDGTEIGMSQIVRSLRREYQKLGKLVTQSDFGEYLPLVRGSA